MTDSTIQFTQTDNIATITLNRPDKRNALNGPMMMALQQTLDLAASDKHCRVLVLQGKGKNFCAGADIAWMQQIVTGSDDKNYDDAQMLADLLYQLYMFPKPTIVLAHGTILGGGMGLLTAADIAIAAKQTRFGFPEVKIGLDPAMISPYVLAAMGERWAHYYYLTGEQFGVEWALQLGLVHQLVEEDALMSAGMVVAKTLLENSPQALSASKQLIRHVATEKISNKLAQKTAEHLAELRMTPEAREGLQAFLEKRKPSWIV